MVRILWSISLVLMAFSHASYAEAPMESLQTAVNKVFDILRQKNLKEGTKKEQLEVVYEQMFDEVEMGRRTLARNWNRLSPAQQQEFIRLYRQVLAKAYLDKILSYTNEKVVFNTERKLSKDQTEVQTKIITSTREIPITYRMIHKENRWKVYDVVVENVSLIQNYRSQFNSILANHSPDQMLEILQKKTQ